MIGTDVKLAAELLKQGELVAIPTETVYGLAANAYDADAILKIYSVKNRPQFNPLIVHTNNIENINSFITFFPPALKKLAEKFWPGPLTILLPKSEKIHDLVTAGNEQVAVRIPDHPLALHLLSILDFPLCAPSANPSGYISPTSARHVDKLLGNNIPYILDGGECSVGIESTIIKINAASKVEILRSGMITGEDISDVTGYFPDLKLSAENPEAPGMLSSHYAPRTQMLLGNIEELLEEHKHKKIALLAFQKNINHPSVIHCCILSPGGSLTEAAKNLFSCLHKLDAAGAEIILAENVQNKGIGIAINDRLLRASA